MGREKFYFRLFAQLWRVLREEMFCDEAGLFLQADGESWKELFFSSANLRSWLRQHEEGLKKFWEGQKPERFEASSFGSILAVPLSAGSAQGIVLLLRKSCPFDNLDTQVAETITRALSSCLEHAGEKSLLPSAPLQTEEEERPLKELIIGESEAIKNIRQTIIRLQFSDAPVLICGESGTGKELVARAIHLHSLRKPAPFVVINCGAIPDHLLESELFGYCRGAFTGALRDKPGLVEEAHGGTLFLDEIADLAFPLQAKLLRLIQEREFRRIGENRVRHSNIRFLSATNRDLEQEIRAGRFREDLYYRLKIISLELPPLRNRKEDLLSLINHFLKIYGPNLGKTAAVISPGALERLLAYDWPGNVRELQNEIQRCLIFCGPEGVIEERHLSPKLSPFPEEVAARNENFFIARAEFERRYLRAALARYNYNRTLTACGLGLSRQGLAKLMKKHRLYEKDKSGNYLS